LSEREPTVILLGMRLGFAIFALGLVASAARADTTYQVEQVVRDGDTVRVFAHADLAPAEAVVRERAAEAVARSAPGLLADRDFGAYRWRDLAVEVRGIRFARGRSAQEVHIDVDAQFTAIREDRSIALRDYLPTFVYASRGRVPIARAHLGVAVEVIVAGGATVLLRVRGERLVVDEPLGLDLDLDRRVLHTHVQPIPDHPSLAGLVPEAAAVRSIANHALHFVVRFHATD